MFEDLFQAARGQHTPASAREAFLSPHPAGPDVNLPIVVDLFLGENDDDVGAVEGSAQVNRTN